VTATPVLFPDALPTEGQATGGCPLYSHPAQLQDNRDCMLCMTCLKACPNRSGQLNLRFPATDLLEHHQGLLGRSGATAAVVGRCVYAPQQHHPRLAGDARIAGSI
jgi:polyferredoxin